MWFKLNKAKNKKTVHHFKKFDGHCHAKYKTMVSSWLANLAFSKSSQEALYSEHILINYFQYIGRYLIFNLLYLHLANNGRHTPLIESCVYIIFTVALYLPGRSYTSLKHKNTIIYDPAPMHWHKWQSCELMLLKPFQQAASAGCSTCLWLWKLHLTAVWADEEPRAGGGAGSRFSHHRRPCPWSIAANHRLHQCRNLFETLWMNHSEITHQSFCHINIWTAASSFIRPCRHTSS